MEENKRTVYEIRKEIADILGIPVRNDIENEDEYSSQYGLGDNEILRIQELREELLIAIREGRYTQESEQENDSEDSEEPDEEQEKTKEELLGERFENLVDLMGNIKTADDMSRDKQNEIDTKKQEVRNETRIVRVEEGQEEIARLEAEKIEFDEMTRAALERARNEVRELQQQTELEYQAKLLEFLEKQKEVQRKLDSMRAKGLDPEKLAKAEKFASEALEKLKKEMDDYQSRHFERRAILDEYAKYIENDINVVYENIKYQPPEPENEHGEDGNSHGENDGSGVSGDRSGADGDTSGASGQNNDSNDENEHHEGEQDENGHHEDEQGENPNPEAIDIPDIPKIRDIDMGDIEEEYTRRKNDMFAKYYGDSEYEQEYQERVERHKSNEVTLTGSDGIEYKTIQDYPEREEDEKFLLLDGYKDALERSSRYEAGDTSVYQGTPEEIAAKLARDKKYVETRNSTFDQHKYTRRDLATMGKYGEEVSYLPMETGGTLAKFGKGILNAGIFARNMIAPVYRFVGKHIAQPIHRAIYGDKEASPYKNNPFHRMVARRDYFSEQARKRDEEATAELMKNAQPGDNVKPVRHPIRNWASSRFNAIFRAKQGNEAVLRAGAFDIQENIKAQNMERLTIEAYRNHIQDMGRQLTELQAQLDKNPDAPNAEAVRQAIEQRREVMLQEQEAVDRYDNGDKITTRQTDAVSDKQHAIASKEVNTLRTTALKSTVKVVTGRFVGPAIKKWMIEHTQTKVTVHHAPTYEKQWQPEVTGTRDITVDQLDTDSMRDITVGDLFNSSSDKTVSLGANGFGNTTTRDAFTNIRGFSYTGSNGQVYSMSDGLGFNIAGRTSTSVPAEFLNPDGTINSDTPLLEILASLKRGTGENVTAQDLLSEVTSLSSPQEQAQKFQELCSSLNFWQSTQPTGIPSGWNDMANEISDFTSSLNIVPVVTGTEQYVIEPGKWVEALSQAAWDESFAVNNPRVINALNNLARAGKVVRISDGVYDLVENVRNTHTDIADNKEQPRQYDYTDKSTKKIPTSRGEYLSDDGDER